MVFNMARKIVAAPNEGKTRADRRREGRPAGLSDAVGSAAMRDVQDW
jgi:hypothetical protein